MLSFISAYVGKLVLQDADLNSPFEIIYVILFSIFLFTVLFLWWSDTRKPLIGIGGGVKGLTLLRDKPDEETIDKFVTKLKKRIKERIIKLKVRPHDKELAFEYKMRMLNLLLDEGVIDQKKYNEVLAQITKIKKGVDFNQNFFGMN